MFSTTQIKGIRISARLHAFFAPPQRNTLGIYVHVSGETKAKAADEIVEMLHLDEKYCSQGTV